jgi:hypothetical protein
MLRASAAEMMAPPMPPMAEQSRQPNSAPRAARSSSDPEQNLKAEQPSDAAVECEHRVGLRWVAAQPAGTGSTCLDAGVMVTPP